MDKLATLLPMSDSDQALFNSAFVSPDAVARLTRGPVDHALQARRSLLARSNSDREADAVESLSRFVPLAVNDDAPVAPAGMRGFLKESLDPAFQVDETDPRFLWIKRHGLRLMDLTKANLASVDSRLGQADDGTMLGARTSNRRRTIARSCIRRAVQLDLLTAQQRLTAAEQ